jgi:hypothetical protein
LNARNCDKELAGNSLFKEMLNLRLKSDDKNMAHEELVLRFFAYHDSEYKRVKNLSYFLTDYMKNNQNPSSDKISELRNLFSEYFLSLTSSRNCRFFKAKSSLRNR